MKRFNSFKVGVIFSLLLFLFTNSFATNFIINDDNLIDSEEYAFFEEHLNPSIYDCLESKIEPWGIVSMWESCKTYMIGDYVLYNGLVYKFIGKIGRASCRERV